MNAEEFKHHILERFLHDIQTVEKDNYCAERFSFDGVDRSEMFDFAKHAAYLDWFVSHYANVYDVYCNWADDESRRLYVDVLRFKLAGHLHVRINAPATLPAQQAAKFDEVFSGSPSAVQVGGMFGELRYYDGVWNNTRYTVDTLINGLSWTLVRRQYYFERNGITIQPEPGDHLIDGGACTGDTSVVFSRSVGPTGKVYAFDPVQSHFDICKVNFSRPGYENVEILPFGLSDQRVDAPLVGLQSYSPGFRVSEGLNPLARIDDLVAAGKIERIDFIKMDIEGSEMAALRGARASIERFKPKLAISIYHKPNDYFEVLQYLNRLGLGYRFYLDQYTPYDEETVLYAA